MRAASPVVSNDWNKFYLEVPADDVPWELGGPSYELSRLVSEGFIVAPARVLDIGSGLGSQSIYLAKNGFEVIGIDIAPEAVRKSQKLAEFSKADVIFKTADVTALPFTSDSFDIIYDRGCFQHLQPQEQYRYRTEINRVLTESGTLVLSVFAQTFSARELETFFGPTFTLVEEDVYSLTEKGTSNSITWRSLFFEKEALLTIDLN